MIFCTFSAKENSVLSFYQAVPINYGLLLSSFSSLFGHVLKHICSFVIHFVLFTDIFVCKKL